MEGDALDRQLDHCPACGVGLAPAEDWLVDDDGLDCPNCGASLQPPMNPRPSRPTRPPVTALVLIGVIFGPPVVVTGYALAAHPDTFPGYGPWVGGWAAVAAGVAGAVGAGWRGGWVLVNVWAWVFLVGGVGLFALGIPMLLVWCLGVFLMMAAVPVGLYGFLLRSLGQNPDVRAWCLR